MNDAGSSSAKDLGRPIAPREVEQFRRKYCIPPFVFDAFNEIIGEHFANNRSKFKVLDIQRRVKEKMEDPSKFKFEWLQVQDSYRAVGWKVTLDQPAYDEDYPSTFLFQGPV